MGLLISSFMLTIRDYAAYGRDPETALLFEAAATELGERLRAEEAGTAVYLDRWFWDEATQKGWPSIPFLADLHNVTMYRPEFAIPSATPGQPVAIYAWPFGDLSFVPQLITPPALVWVQAGSLARGDLEETAYPLYVRYAATPLLANWLEAVNFADQIHLRHSTVALTDAQTLQVDLYWAAETVVNPNLVAFVQIIGPDGIIAQSDLPPGGGLWAADWWRPGLVVRERREIEGARPFDRSNQRIIVGLYDALTGERLPVVDENHRVIADSWEIAR
jgi:hypothetical protein